jgi:long-chain acyl-CoA synthetase
MLTGDLGCMDRDGFLFLVDRKKDMIVTGGENVYSVEVERALSTHPDVAAVAVIGVPSARWGEEVLAFVVPRPDTAPAVDSLIAHCRTAIAAYKCPRRIELVESLPLSGAGKVLKHALRERFWKDAPRHVN